MAQVRSVQGLTGAQGSDGEDILVRGLLSIKSAPDGGQIYFLAAAPPDYRSSFSGSALPFANADQAFYNTPNRGVVKVALDGSFEITLRVPNSYYVGHGTVRVPPTLHIVYYNRGERVSSSLQVSEGVPYRSLTYPAKRANAMFYSPYDSDARSQEEILRASAYPDVNTEAPNFWGSKPPK
jgi:hypothetical protein